MPDFNPDKERHVDHKWIVHKTEFTRGDGVVVGDKKLKFGKNGWLRLSDPGQAAEIRQTYGNDVTVTRVRNPAPVSDRGHRYHFGQMLAMPWAKYDEFGRRIKDGQEQENEQNIV